MTKTTIGNNPAILRSMVFSAVALTVALTTWSTFAADGKNSPYPLGANKHLFLDEFMIAEKSNVKLTVNPPRLEELVLIADKPWERGGITAYCNVLWDPQAGQYRLYYVPVDLGSSPIYRLAMATSTDGIHWQKPNLGVVEWKGSKENNIVIDGQREGTVMIDPNGTPERRYVYISSDPTIKTRLFTSPDGIHWQMQPQLICDLHSDSQISSFWDDRLHKYVHFFKLYTAEYQRCTARVEVDKVDSPWPQDRPIVLARDEHDPADTDLYTNSAEKYRLAENAYFAFPTPYYHYNYPPRKYLNDPALARGGKMNDGTLDTQLATSRDGKKWIRYRTPYVPVCKYLGLDLRVNMVFPGLIYHDTHIDHYFAGYAFTHGDTQARVRLKGRELGGVFRIRQRIDGFISADFDYEGGVILTEPFIFDGGKLVLNLNTSASGEARVAILDEDGNTIDGYSIDDCHFINGDYPAKVVTWNKGADVSKLAGKPVRLRFEMRGTKLYAFQFQP